MAEISVTANAKINLFLRVLSQRDDGYHELETLIAPISLADEIVCRSADRLHLRLSEGSLAVSRGPDNLAIVAALALGEACRGGGAEIELVKRIPVAAGLGGGSADAAAVLRALNELWSCDLPGDAISAIASKIGSDVPALLSRTAVIAGGRGEKLAAVTLPETWWVLVTFPFEIRTPDSYRWWDEDGAPTGPSGEGVSTAAEAGDLNALGRRLFNDLEAAVFRRHAGVADAKARLLEESEVVGAVMCGSGPTIAALCRDEPSALDLAARLPSAYTVHTLG